MLTDLCGEVRGESVGPQQQQPEVVAGSLVPALPGLPAPPAHQPLHQGVRAARPGRAVLPYRAVHKPQVLEHKTMQWTEH